MSNMNVEQIFNACNNLGRGLESLIEKKCNGEQVKIDVRQDGTADDLTITFALSNKRDPQGEVSPRAVEYIEKKLPQYVGDAFQNTTFKVVAKPK